MKETSDLAAPAAALAVTDANVGATRVGNPGYPRVGYPAPPPALASQEAEQAAARAPRVQQTSPSMRPTVEGPCTLTPQDCSAATLLDAMRASLLRIPRLVVQSAQEAAAAEAAAAVAEAKRAVDLAASAAELQRRGDDLQARLRPQQTLKVHCLTPTTLGLGGRARFS